MKQHKITKCSLSIECRFLSSRTPTFNGELLYKIPQSEPIAGQAFYILDSNAEDILKKYQKIIWLFPSGDLDFYYPDADRILGTYISNILSAAEADPRKYLIALMHSAALMSDTTPLICISYLIATDVLNSRAIRFLKTDRLGTAKTDDLRPGIYFVCGVFAMGRGTRVWNVRIDMKPGENSLRLDNYNAIA